MNKLVLYCKRLDQAALWEVCRKKRCKGVNCLFRSAAEKFGDDLYSCDPKRYQTLQEIEADLEMLTSHEGGTQERQKKAIPLRRMPLRRTSVVSARWEVSSLTDILKDEIRDEVSK